jgi:hypothetical protein
MADPDHGFFVRRQAPWLLGRGGRIAGSGMTQDARRGISHHRLPRVVGGSEPTGMPTAPCVLLLVCHEVVP